MIFIDRYYPASMLDFSYFAVFVVLGFRVATAKPLGGRWIDNFEMGNATDYYDDNEEISSTVIDQAANACFTTIAECNSRCPVSCREVADCGGIPGIQYACSWDLVIIVVAVAVLAAVLLLLCFLTWKQRQTRRSQLEYGRVDSNENLLRRCSRQRAGSIIAATVSSSGSAEGSRRNSYIPNHPTSLNNSVIILSASTSPTRIYPHYL